MLIEVSGLGVKYDDIVALKDVSLGIGGDQIVGILGPNGSGKSTLIKCIAGVLKPTSGSLKLSIERKKVAYVPQRSSVDWDFPASVKDVVKQGRYPHLGLFGRYSKSDNSKVESALERMGLTELSRRQIGELSGGQAQRVFLARALAQEAELLLLDEPFQGVDAVSEAALMQVLKQFRQDGKTVLVVHHDLQTVQEYFDRVILLNQTLVASGETSEVFNAQNVKSAYGGRVAIFPEAP